jgi:hypothetical protein
VGDGSSQPGWIQLPGCLEQDRFGVGGGVGGQVVGAISQHRGMGRGELPVHQCLGGLGEGAAEHRPGRPHRTMRSASPHAEPIPQPAGRGGGLDALVGPGGTTGVQVGQVLEPVAFELIDQPPQPMDAFGSGGVDQAVALAGAVPAYGGGERLQLVN